MSEEEIIYYKRAKKKGQKTLTVARRGVKKRDENRDTYKNDVIVIKLGGNEIELNVEDANFLGRVLCKWSMRIWEELVEFRKALMRVSVKEEDEESLRYVR